MSASRDVAPCTGAHAENLAHLLARFGLALVRVNDGEPIPGTHWGDPEAGLVGSAVYARVDTPIHSVLHEACHVVCMSNDRRTHLHTDAGGDTEEENAVCYLSIVLADELPGFGRALMMEDMDLWGYTFRLAGARPWFELDASEAKAWLIAVGILDTDGNPTWAVNPGAKRWLNQGWRGGGAYRVGIQSPRPSGVRSKKFHTGESKSRPR